MALEALKPGTGGHLRDTMQRGVTNDRPRWAASRSGPHTRLSEGPQPSDGPSTVATALARVESALERLRKLLPGCVVSAESFGGAVVVSATFASAAGTWKDTPGSAGMADCVRTLLAGVLGARTYTAGIAGGIVEYVTILQQWAAAEAGTLR